MGASEAGSLKSTEHVSASLAYRGKQPRYKWRKSMRLRHRRQFRRLWQEGRSWTHPLFVLRIAPHNEGETHIGFIASRKIGNAVVRNRVRRLLREAARRLYPQLPAGLDIVLIARRPLRDARGEQVEAALRHLLRRAGVLKETGD